MCFTARCWSRRDAPEPRPAPRYGQSQLRLRGREDRLLVLGGCGGPNNVFSDVWLLEMDAAHAQWRWRRCQVRNADAAGAAHMWCHPAVRSESVSLFLHLLLRLIEKEKRFGRLRRLSLS